MYNIANKSFQLCRVLMEISIFVSVVDLNYIIMKRNIFLFILIAILAIVCVCALNYQKRQDEERNRRAMEEDEIITREIQKNRERWDSVSYRTIHLDLSDENTKER